MASTHSQVSESEFQCAECNKIFPTKRKLTGHFSSTHERVSCGFCSKICGNKFSLNGHIKTVHESPKLECDFCDKKYGHKYRLSQHVRLVHLKEKQHKCSLCHRAFQLKKDLRKHELFMKRNEILSANHVTNLSLCHNI